MAAVAPEPGQRPGGEEAVAAGARPTVSAPLSWLDFGPARPQPEPEVAEVIGAGFTHGTGEFGPVRGRTGFEAGGHADVLEPCSVLAELTGQARHRMDELSDDELVGVLRAARRVASWQAAVELEAIAELAARRHAEPQRPGPAAAERMAAELAAALTLTSRAASALAATADGVQRLEVVGNALARADIDLPKARVFADELAQLGWLPASMIASRVLLAASGLTTAQLRARLRREVLAADPEAVRRRQRAAAGEARVEAWQEGSGNAALAGRELPPAAALAADRHLSALARTLQGAGLDATLDQARAAVYLALLSGQTPESLLPPAAQAADDTAGPQPAGPQRAGPQSSGPPDAPVQPDPAGGSGLAWPDGLRGSINLTMPLSAWLGLSDRPGEVAGHGPADAWTCRQLATRLASQPCVPCCLTITDPDGQPLGHGCARTPPPGARAGPWPRAGPGPPAGQPSPWTKAGAWLGSLRVDWLGEGPCDHALQTPRYRPTAKLAHLITIWSPACTAPGCRRPAPRCDLDHVQPYDQGGRTCVCNLHPGCRHHHQLKQLPGWHVQMIRPGILAWTLPHGRTYTTATEPYPI